MTLGVDGIIEVRSEKNITGNILAIKKEAETTKAGLTIDQKPFESLRNRLYKPMESGRSYYSYKAPPIKTVVDLSDSSQNMGLKKTVRYGRPFRKIMEYEMNKLKHTSKSQSKATAESSELEYPSTKTFDERSGVSKIIHHKRVGSSRNST